MAGQIIVINMIMQPLKKRMVGTNRHPGIDFHLVRISFKRHLQYEVQIVFMISIIRFTNTPDNDNNDYDIRNNYNTYHHYGMDYFTLLLCTNPAIQYTMYDTLKNALIQYKWNRSSTVSMTLLSGNEEAAAGRQTQSSLNLPPPV